MLQLRHAFVDAQYVLSIAVAEILKVIFQS